LRNRSRKGGKVLRILTQRGKGFEKNLRKGSLRFENRRADRQGVGSTVARGDVMTYHMVMKQVTMAKAKAELYALLDRVEAGETVAITRRHRVVAEVRPAGSRRRLKPRPFGLCRGEFRTPDDFDAPLPADVLAAFDGRA
jgi:antitoxin (DNA-binding transcriptional repressor) of toxin-antitoxin stability system